MAEDKLFSLLEEAAELDGEAVAQLIEAGVPLDARNKHGETPLHVLCRRPSRFNCTGSDLLSLVQLLLERGADVSARNKDGRTPLHHAVGMYFSRFRVTCRRLIKLLVVEHHADINARDNKGVTPLILAAKTRSICDVYPTVEALLDLHADVNAQDEAGTTALQGAFRQYLTGVSPRREKHRSLDQLVCLLIRRGANISVTDKVKGWTPLHLAVFWGLPTAVALLLQAEHEAEVNVGDLGGNTPLHLFVQRCDWYEDGQGTEIVQLLANRGADPLAANHKGEMPLFDLLRKQHWESVLILLQHCTSLCVNIKDQLGDTPLSIVVQKANVDLVSLLIERGADMNILDCHGMSPFLTACEMGNLDIIYRLIRFSPHHVRPQLLI